MAKNIPDLDAELAFEDEPQVTIPIHLFGRDWDLNASVNSFSVSAFMAEMDGPAVYRYLKGLVVDEQWDEFSAALNAKKDLTFEKLMLIINSMTQKIVDRPLEQASGSRPGPTKRTSSPKSAASTASKRASTSPR